MNIVEFNGIKTTSIGFGTSLLTRNNCLKDALLNLETAYDCGIRHFDVSRLYGFGQAEEIVGMFSKNKRESITITTKSGLSTLQIPLFALPFLNKFRKIIKKSSKITNTANGLLLNGKFSSTSIQKDLELSLTKLKTDYIDFYLLHEANIYQANYPEILNTLEFEKKKGKILNFGIASNALKIVNDFSILNEKYEIIQHNSNLVNDEIHKINIDNLKRLRIVYNIFSYENKKYAEYLYLQSGFTNPYEFILNLYKNLNSSGITLFSSLNNNNIKATSKIWFQ